MIDRESTKAESLLRSAEIGHEAGLRYVYPGNMPGRVGDGENTKCPTCSETLVERIGFHVRRNRLSNGRCPSCATAIPGVW